MNHSRLRGQRGLTLIELMIAMVLGLFLLGGVISVFVGSKQAYRTNEALARAQESGRFAIEFISYDVRMAGMTGCGRTDRVANTLNNPGDWWKNFGGSGIVGYDGATAFPGMAVGGNPGDRVAGTDAFTLLGGKPTNYSITEHVETSAQFKLNNLHDLRDGSIVMVCDNRQASIMQLTNVNNSNVTIVHNTGTGTPGNCSKGLGFPTDCSSTNGNPYQYGPDSILVEYNVAAYYIGNSSLGGGRSLYRQTLSVTSSSSTAAPVAQELVEGVQDMQVLYGVDTSGNNEADSYLPAVSVADWNEVVAARVSLLTISPEGNVVADGPQVVVFNGGNVQIPDNRLAQVFTSTIGLRNRLP